MSAGEAGGVGRERTAKVEASVRAVVVSYETDPRRDHHDAPTEIPEWSLAKTIKRDWTRAGAA